MVDDGDNIRRSEIQHGEPHFEQDGGKRRKTVKGPDGKMYYGIVAPQYTNKNGMKTMKKQARAAVWRGDYYRTKSGLTRKDLSKDDRGKIVSKKKQDMMKKNGTWKKYFGKRRARTFKPKYNPKKKTRRGRRKSQNTK